MQAPAVRPVGLPRLRKPGTLKVVEPEPSLRKLTTKLPEHVIDLLVDEARKQKPRGHGTLRGTDGFAG
jgi:hypothetical protein